MACKKVFKTEFSRQVLCAGSMNDFIQIYERAAGVTNPGENTPKPTFTLVDQIAGKLEAVKPVTRWDGVTINNDFTHYAYFSFSVPIYKLDTSKLWVKIATQTERWFKLQGIKDYGEQEQWLQLKMSEKGFTDKEATEG